MSSSLKWIKKYSVFCEQVGKMLLIAILLLFRVYDISVLVLLFLSLGYLAVESKNGDEAMGGQRSLVYTASFLQEIIQNSLCRGESGVYITFSFFSSGPFLSKLLGLIYLCLMSECARYAFIRG